MAGEHTRGKSKVLAALLAFFLGWLGLHHFYLGASGAGVVLLVANCFFGIGWLFAFVEGLVLLVMRDTEFDAKYNHEPPDSMEFVLFKL